MQNPRPYFLFGFLLMAAMLATALVMQYYYYFDPCPLCLFQRLVVIGLMAVFFAGFVANPKIKGRNVYGFVLAILASVGVGLSARQSYLQHNPLPASESCGGGLAMWIDQMPMIDVIKKVFQGTGDCSEIAFQFLGLSIPEWTGVVFILVLLASLKLMFTGPRTRY